jgi:DNA ligase D-like protein (predicted ligase)
VSLLSKELDQADRALLVPAEVPRRAAVMKAVLTAERFSDPDWIFERKLDGIRCLAIRSGAEVRLLSRNDLSLNARYPEIAGALQAEACERFAVDGEIVAFDGATTSFARLAQRGRHRVPVFFYAFDLLWLDGQDLRALPLRSRKRLLRAALSFEQGVRLTPYRNEAGEALYEEACRRGWEGVVAKRAASPYRETRSRDWLKFKCEQGQELLIGGYTAPQGSRTDFGALLLGYYDEGDLQYAGKVGTGFDRATLGDLGDQLRKRRRPDSPFVDGSAIRPRRANWVEPELVAQVGFTEWTRDGRLRHPRFLGLRDDKPAGQVVREG